MANPSRKPPNTTNTTPDPLLQFMPNVRSKPPKSKPHHPHSNTNAKHSPTTTTTTSSIADLSSAISALELTTNPTLNPSKQSSTTNNNPRKCTCNASLHPLFTPAPNCLSCGKIICALEGLQPCSFCGSAILTPEEVQAMIRSLRDERGRERQGVNNSGRATPTGPLSGSNTPSHRPTTPTPPTTTDNNPALSSALAHRNRLLSYQSNSTARTTIHDESSDFASPMSGSQWMTPLQRAAALKKQQAYLREMEERDRPEWERKRTVMSLSVVGGKVVKRFERGKGEVRVEMEDEGVAVDDHEIGEDVVAGRAGEGEGLTRGSGAFSHNPLLKGGLVRPIWKPKDEGNGKEAAAGDEDSSRQRISVWRKVQDDDDNEQWILGGRLSDETK